MAGRRVVVRVENTQTVKPRKAIVFLPGTSGFNKNFTDALDEWTWPEAWVEAWKDFTLVALVDVYGRTSAQGGRAKPYKAALPPYMPEILTWLTEPPLSYDYFLVGYSRGAMWGATLMLEYPRKMMGALLIAGYERDEHLERQLDTARRLLRPGMKCVIVHSLVDEFSNPSTHGLYWKTLMEKPVGHGPYDKSPDLIVVTKNDTHAGLAVFQEGLNFKSNEDRTEFGEMYKWLLDFV